MLIFAELLKFCEWAIYTLDLVNQSQTETFYKISSPAKVALNSDDLLQI